jgi:hypothetical protein
MLDDRIELSCDDSPHVNQVVAAARVAEARCLFGPEIKQAGVYRTAPRWKIEKANLPSAVEFALDDDKFPKQEIGPARISFCYHFCWNEFGPRSRTADETETRRIPSSLAVTIGQQRLFLQPHFVYPAAWNSESLKDFIDRSELIAPFRFRDQYFKRWLPPQGSPSQGRLLRLESTWRSGTVVH